MSGINQPGPSRPLAPPADLLKSIVGLPRAFIARVHHRHAAAAVAQRKEMGRGREEGQFTPQKERMLQKCVPQKESRPIHLRPLLPLFAPYRYFYKF